jgi:hypothetical protein
MWRIDKYYDAISIPQVSPATASLLPYADSSQSKVSNCIYRYDRGKSPTSKLDGQWKSVTARVPLFSAAASGQSSGGRGLKQG